MAKKLLCQSLPKTNAVARRPDFQRQQYKCNRFQVIGTSRMMRICQRAWLRSRQPESKIILWGASLGSAAAVFAADELRTDIAGYILECPYRDLDTAVWNRLQTYLPPLIDRACHIGMRLSARILMPHIDQISPLNHVDTIPKDVPVLILAGAADRRARPEEARALHARIKEHSRLEIIPRADHLQLLQTAPEKYEALVLEFLEKLR